MASSLSIELSRIPDNHLTNTPTSSPLFRLYLAVCANNLKDAEQWLRNGINPNDTLVINKQITIPLFKAVRDNNIDMIKLLIKYKSVLDVIDEREISPLMIAAYNGFSEAFFTLLNAGASYEDHDDKNIKDLHHDIPGRTLIAAIRGGSFDIFQALVERGIDIHAYVTLPVDEVLGCECCKKIENYANVFKKKHYFKTNPLIACATYNRLEMAKLLLEKGVNVNATSYESGSALCQSAEHGYVEMTELLLSYGALLNQFLTKDHKRYRPMEIAAQNRHHDVFQVLILHNSI
jgi:ankyrin repeat protein